MSSRVEELEQPASNFRAGSNVKLGVLTKRCSGLRKWAERYVVLDKQRRILFYYGSITDKKPSCMLELSLCAVTRALPEDTDGRPGMVITVPNVRSFIFVSSQASVVDEWIDAIYSIFVHPATSPLPASQPMLSTPNSLGVTRQSVNSSNGERRFAPPVSMGRGNNTAPNLPPPPPRARGSYPNINDTALPRDQPHSQTPVQDFAAPRLEAVASPPQQNGGTTVGRPTEQSVGGNTAQVTEQATLISGPEDGTLIEGAPRAASAIVIVPSLRLVPDGDPTAFTPIEQLLKTIVKVGRESPNGRKPQDDNMFTFRSKVISRNHAEFWAVNGEVFVRDTKSQSGTFLNAMRLSEMGKESRPYKIKHGDTVQFGVDYRGTKDDDARGITAKVELRNVEVNANASNGGTSTRNTDVENDGTLIVGNVDAAGNAVSRGQAAPATDTSTWTAGYVNDPVDSAAASNASLGGSATFRPPQNIQPAVFSNGGMQQRSGSVNVLAGPGTPLRSAATSGVGGVPRQLPARPPFPQQVPQPPGGVPFRMSPARGVPAAAPPQQYPRT